MCSVRKRYCITRGGGRGKPYRPIGLWDVEAPTFSRQSNHRQECHCQPYVPARRPLPPGRFLVLIFEATMRLEGLGQLIKSNDRHGNWTRDLLACSIVPQPTTLQMVVGLSPLSSNRPLFSPRKFPGTRILPQCLPTVICIYREK
jgi:hypothetical protein